MSRGLRLDQVRVGDLLKHGATEQGYVVISTAPLVAVRTIVVNNPVEWRVIRDGQEVGIVP